MKRGGFLKRHTPLRSKTGLKVRGHSDTADVKDDIQGTLREIAILRDGGCILRDIDRSAFPDIDIPECGGIRKDGQMILQADHLITRSNSATYGEPRLVVCVCRSHHGWKSLGSNLRKQQYDIIVRALLPADRVELWDKCEKESWKPTRVHTQDWRIILAFLRQQLRQMREQSTVSSDYR